MDEMEEVEELFQVAEEAMQEQAEGGRAGGAGANTSRRRMRTNRLRPTATGSTPVVGQEAYCRGDDGTQTWRVREQMNPIQAPFHVADPRGR